MTDMFYLIEILLCLFNDCTVWSASIALLVLGKRLPTITNVLEVDFNQKVTHHLFIQFVRVYLVFIHFIDVVWNEESVQVEPKKTSVGKSSMVVHFDEDVSQDKQLAFQ